MKLAEMKNIKNKSNGTQNFNSVLFINMLIQQSKANTRKSVLINKNKMGNKWGTYETTKT
jgi:hypothetical protein